MRTGTGSRSSWTRCWGAQGQDLAAAGAGGETAELRGLETWCWGRKHTGKVRAEAVEVVGLRKPLGVTGAKVLGTCEGTEVFSVRLCASYSR